jgi:hypothetical protein
MDWTHSVTDIPANGLVREREATDGEREQIARALGLLKLKKLVARYRIAPLRDGAYRLSGEVRADVEQACIVTLEPVGAVVEAPLEVEFRPKLDATDNDTDASVLSGPDLEILDRGIIPLGRIVFETLSASLDPFPRRPDAEFTWQDPRAEEPEKSSPFAALSTLKDKK